MENRKILIVEDQADIAGLLKLHLGDLGAQVTVASDGHEGLRLSTTLTWDLLILDIQLPGPSGLEICRSVRNTERYVPIMLLTSRSSELDRVLGLDLGADDYITKPFSVMEVIARIKAVFRRATAMQSQVTPVKNEVVTIGPLSLDEKYHLVTLADKKINLTAREFDLLLYFANHPGRVYSRADLIDNVWGYGHDGYEHTVNSHINRLRSKIESDPNNPRIIVTVWGVGYKLAAEGLSQPTLEDKNASYS